MRGLRYSYKREPCQGAISSTSRARKIRVIHPLLQLSSWCRRTHAHDSDSYALIRRPMACPAAQLREHARRRSLGQGSMRVLDGDGEAITRQRVIGAPERLTTEAVEGSKFDRPQSWSFSRPPLTGRATAVRSSSGHRCAGMSRQPSRVKSA